MIYTAFISGFIFKHVVVDSESSHFLSFFLIPSSYFNSYSAYMSSQVPHSFSACSKFHSLSFPLSVIAWGGGTASRGGPPAQANEGHVEQGPGGVPGRLFRQSALSHRAPCAAGWKGAGPGPSQGDFTRSGDNTGVLLSSAESLFPRDSSLVKKSRTDRQN